MDDTPDVNSGTPWTEWAVEDLKYAASHGQTVEKIAGFLCRSVKEVRDKAAELNVKLPGGG